MVADVGVTYNSSATYEHVVSHGPDVRRSSPCRALCMVINCIAPLAPLAMRMVYCTTTEGH